MADVVLVHGSCHGAWCWRDVLPALGDLGHRVRAIDLPGAGNDPVPAAKVTLESYAQAILSACTQRTVLVGHSMGGYAIAAAAAQSPSIVERLIYLAAYVPCDGLTMAQMRAKAPRQPLLKALQLSEDGASFSFDPNMLRDLFFHDCTDEQVAFASSNLSQQATAPSHTAISQPEALARVERRYIRCTKDRVIPPEYQEEMTKGWPSTHVEALTSGHSPFFAMPGALAHAIDRAIRN